MIFSRQRYKIKDEDRQFLDYIPPASIFIGGIIFLVGTIGAIMFYQTPNGDYKFFEQFFSELGIRQDYIHTFSDGTTEQRFAPDNPEIFNITLFASGFLMIPFFMFSYRQMRNHNVISNIFLSFAIVAGVLAGPMLIGVGIFDLSFNTTEFWQEHGFWVANLYLFLTVASISWFIMLLTAKDLPYRRSKWIILDVLLLIILTGLTMLNILDGLGILFVSDIPFLDTYPIELYQKLIAYVFFIYYGLIVGGRLTKTKYDNTPADGDHSKLHDDAVIYCTNCGEENPGGSPFCTKCGVKL